MDYLFSYEEIKCCISDSSDRQLIPAEREILNPNDNSKIRKIYIKLVDREDKNLKLSKMFLSKITPSLLYSRIVYGQETS